MSFEKNPSKEVNNNLNEQKEIKITQNSIGTNILCKPVAIKHNVLNPNQLPFKENKYPNPPPMYKTPIQTPYISDKNKINYIKNQEPEIPKYINNTKDISKNNPNDMGAFSSFINTNPINNNPRINNINYIKNDSNSLPISKIHCTCKKTKCIKKYCECYSSGNLCYNCKCENCENKPYYNENIPNQKKEEENNNNIIELNEDEDENEEKKLIICTCSKSGCNKNYCECFKAKVKCNNKCRCIKCLNKQEENKETEGHKIIMRSKSTPINIPSDNNNNVNNNNVENNNITNIANNFTVHRISVVINKAQTLINTEKLDSYDSFKFLNKKKNTN